MSGARVSLSVVLPAYNEGENLDAVVADVLRYLDGREGEVVVVDDGSTDHTPRLLAAWAEREPRVRPVRHRENRGYGAAVRAGLSWARGERVCLMDADRQFAATDIARLEARAGEADLVIGYRSPRGDSWARTLGGRGWTALVNASLGLHVRDVDCALKLLDRRVIARCPLRSAGAFVSAELLARAAGEGFVVREVPVPHRPRPAGRATGLSLGVAARACLELAVVGRPLRRQM